MILLGWVEQAAFTTLYDDRAGNLRHHWIVVFRCPGCNRVETAPHGMGHELAPGAPPAPVTGEHAQLLGQLIGRHQCQEAAHA